MTSHSTTLCEELELAIEYEYQPAHPGNPDIESRTCCPPEPAGVSLIDVKVYGVSILATMPDRPRRSLEATILEDHDDG